MYIITGILFLLNSLSNKIIYYIKNTDCFLKISNVHMIRSAKKGRPRSASKDALFAKRLYCIVFYYIIIFFIKAINTHTLAKKRFAAGNHMKYGCARAPH